MHQHDEDEERVDIEIDEIDEPGIDEILSAEALAFVADLHLEFNERREALLAARIERQSAIDAGESWVTDAEYMVKGQAGPRGANGSVFAARVLWSKPNDLAPRKAR